MTDKKNEPSEDGTNITLEHQTPPKTGGHESRPEESTPPDKNGREPVYGVFSSEVVSMVGTGSTKRKQTKLALWFVEEVASKNGDEPVVQVRSLTNKNLPSGKTKTVPFHKFLHDYKPEIEYYQTTVYPKMKELDKLLDRSEKQRELGAYYSAQFGFEAAREFDEQNVRANFGLGLTYMARDDMDKAADIFKQVIALDASFSPEHKHLFNEFGINLRKSRLFDQAVAYYTRALEIIDDDENLYYNIARAHFERGDRDDCQACLKKALALNPDFEEAKEFLARLEHAGASSDVSLD